MRRGRLNTAMMKDTLGRSGMKQNAISQQRGVHLLKRMRYGQGWLDVLDSHTIVLGYQTLSIEATWKKERWRRCLGQTVRSQQGVAIDLRYLSF